MSWLHPSTLAALTGAVVLAGVYWFLFLQYRERPMQVWAWGWSLYALRCVFEMLPGASGAYPLAEVTAWLCLLGSSLLLLHGSTLFLGRETSGFWLAAAVVAGAWTVTVPWTGWPFVLQTLPVFFLAGGILAWAGIILLRSAAVEGMGKHVAGWSFILWGVHKIDYPFLRPLEWLAPWGYLLAGMLGLTAAIGVLLAYFQKVRAEMVLSKERFRQMAENIGEVFWMTSPDSSKVLYVNPAFEKVWGIPCADLYAQPQLWFGAIHPDDRAAAQAALAALSGGSEQCLEYRVVRPDGAVRWVSNRGYPVRDDTGEVTLIAGLVADVTERRETLEELRKLSRVVEQSPASVVITDPQGRIEYVNPAFLQLTGYDPGEVLGQNPRILKSGVTDPEEYRRLWQTITAGREWHGEFLNRKKNGELYWESAVISPVRNGKGEITCFVGIKQDITEHKQVQENERRSRRLSEAMAGGTLAFLQSGDIGAMARILTERCVAITGAAFGFLYDLTPGGDARLLAVAAREGREPGGDDGMARECGGEDGFRLVPRSDSLLFAPVAKTGTILRNGPDQDADLVEMLPESPAEIVSFLGTPLKIGGEIVGAIGLVNRPGGFTGQEQAEVEAFAPTAALAVQSARTELAHQEATERLRQAQKMEAVGQLAGGIAHDFNNLLTVINGYGTLLLHSLPQEDPQRREVEHIVHAGERAAGLTRQLLAFSRRQVLAPKVLDLNEMVRNLEKILRRLIREDIAFSLGLADDLGRVKADPGQVEQILMNLAINARDAMPGGGTVTIATGNAEFDAEFARHHTGSVPGRYVMLAVTDTGIGMSEEIQRRVFEPFFTTKEQGRGTGLGLATVYGIVKQSGGYILVDSRPQEGSSFRVYLPRTEEPVVPDRLEGRRSLPRQKATVLVVEDEKEVLGLLAQSLRDAGFAVLAASAPEQALALFEQSGDAVDLLLTDMVMPGMSGVQLADSLQRARRELKVLFMSGYGQLHGAPAADMKGRAFIQKPFTPDTLAVRVRELLAGRPGR